jgi:hypothetical protein
VTARLAVVKQDREPISIRLKAFGCLRTGNLAAWTNSTDNPTAPRQPDDMHQPDSPNPLKRKASDDESSNLDDVTLYWQQRMQRKKQAHVGATADQIRLLSQSFQPTCKYKVHPLSRKRPLKRDSYTCTLGTRANALTGGVELQHCDEQGDRGV